MEKIYIAIKGEARNHRSNVDVLDNNCSVCKTYTDAYNEAMGFIYNGSLTAQIFKLETAFSVDKVTVTMEDGVQEDPLTKEY